MRKKSGGRQVNYRSELTATIISIGIIFSLLLAHLI